MTSLFFVLVADEPPVQYEHTYHAAAYAIHSWGKRNHISVDVSFLCSCRGCASVQYTHAYQVAAYSTIVRGKGTMFWLAFIFFVLVADEPPVQHEYAQQYMPQ